MNPNELCRQLETIPITFSSVTESISRDIVIKEEFIWIWEIELIYEYLYWLRSSLKYMSK